MKHKIYQKKKKVLTILANNDAYCKDLLQKIKEANNPAAPVTAPATPGDSNKKDGKKQEVMDVTLKNVLIVLGFMVLTAAISIFATSKWAGRSEENANGQVKVDLDDAAPSPVESQA